MSLVDDTSGFSTGLFPFQDSLGRMGYTLVVRGTFDLAESDGLVISKEQDPVVVGDTYGGEPGLSSVLSESDVSWFKPATDVVMVGSAHAPYGQPVREMQVVLRVGAVEKRVDVVGDRYWGLLGFSEPEPFTEMPLIYERAFGGADPVEGESASRAWCKQNPVGTGFRVKGRESGLPLPNLEDPRARIRSSSDKPVPQSFGFIGRDWEPRASLAGTFDEAWRREQFPLSPLDFRHEYFQGAHPDLVHRPYLEGDEAVEIVGASPEGRLSFWLPGITVGVTFHMRRSSPELRRALLDTVILRPGDRKVNLVWRSTIRCRRGIHDLRRVVSFRVKLDTVRRYHPQVAQG